jgi:hypothetical protein
MTISSKALPKSVSDRGNYDQKEAIYGLYPSLDDVGMFQSSWKGS